MRLIVAVEVLEIRTSFCFVDKISSEMSAESKADSIAAATTASFSSEQTSDFRILFRSIDGTL